MGGRGGDDRKSALSFQGEDLQIPRNKYPSQKTSVGDRRGHGVV